MNKKKRPNFWYIYVFGVCASIFCINLGVSIKCAPTEKESIYVFAACQSHDVAGFVKESKIATDNKIRKVSLIQGDPTDKSIYTLFSSYFSITDFYILPTSWLEKINIISLHYSEDEIVRQIPLSNSYSFAEDDDGKYAFKIYDYQTKEGYMKDYFSYLDEDYFILMREASFHISPLKDTYTDSVLKIINHLLEL